ncbi:ankyrin, partial [Mycena vulgaris]
AVERGDTPALSATETVLKLGYADLLILGALHNGPPASMRYLETLNYLFCQGLPADVEDVAGFTAIHHATRAFFPNEALARSLLEHGANPNHQNRFGDIPLLGAMQLKALPMINLLMEFGTDLDLVLNVTGVTTRRLLVTFGPQVIAAVTKCIRKRSGETAPHAENHCDSCGKTNQGPLKHCAKCKLARYCSVECQKKEWPAHRHICQPLSSSNSVVLTPCYSDIGCLPAQPIADTVRQERGYPIQFPCSYKHTRLGHIPRSLDYKAKVITIKVQVPYNLYSLDPSIESTEDLLVYTQTRDFACTIRRSDSPTEYDRITQVVRAKGVGGAKAYFIAELQSKERLVVQVSDVLAEQPW